MMTALTDKKQTSTLQAEQDEKDSKPFVDDFSDDNGEADVDISYIKEMTLHYEKELIEFSQPVTFTIRRKQNEEESGSKIVLDVYLSTSNVKPS